MEALREITDKLIDKGLDLFVVFNKLDDKVVIVVKRKKTLDRIHSGKIARLLAEVLSGGGGGRPDFAQAGGKDPTKINEAVQKLREYLKDIN
jgi:alanyl-tRNA synthetase